MAPQIDEQFVDAIVAGVMNRLRQGSAPTSPTAVPTKPAAARVEKTPNPTANNGDAFLINERVVTEATLLELAPSRKRIHFTPGTVLTPTARDYLRTQGVIWKFAERASGGNATHGPAAVLAILVHEAPAVERVLAAQLPTAKRELRSCPDDAAELAAGELARGEHETVLIFARQTHRAACLANRQSAVKAVAVEDVNTVKAIHGQLRANCWCLDPTRRGGFELKNILRAIIDGRPRSKQ